MEQFGTKREKFGKTLRVHILLSFPYMMLSLESEHDRGVLEIKIFKLNNPPSKTQLQDGLSGCTGHVHQRQYHLMNTEIFT